MKLNAAYFRIKYFLGKFKSWYQIKNENDAESMTEGMR